MSVGGNFIIVGTTVYNTNSFTINANSSIGLNSNFSVNRGISGANAAIRWNETNKYFDMNDVDNGLYYRVLTDEYLSNSTNLASSSNVATSLAVNYLQNVDNTQNTRIQSIETINTNQNTSISIIESVNTTQNTRLNSIETVDIDQNTAISIIQGVNATQNTRLGSIETVDVAQNTAISIIQGVDATQNTRIQSIETINSNQNTTITQVNQYSASAYAYANTLPTPSGTNATGTWAIDISGNAATVTNGVYTTGNQTIGGTKTFTSTISGTVTDGVVTSASYSNPSWIIALAGSKITGNISGAATSNPLINPGSPKDGDIQVSGSTISIYAAGAWRQVFPALYS